MKVERFLRVLDFDFYTGVPDSLLRPLCDYLMSEYGIDPNHHIIAANEGNCAAIAAGYYLATGKTPVVYMQNSGEGNVVNPSASLLNDAVYSVPMVFVVGWRGEPGVQDEPQHVYQGKITLKLLKDLGIKTFVVDNETSEEELKTVMNGFRSILSEGKDVAFVIKKGALTSDTKVKYENGNNMSREDVIRHIVEFSEKDPIISTTGKASRELFETRVSNGEDHKYDFLTVGSMGHCSSIALGVAVNKPQTRIWCIDGDGAVLMHMGALAVIGSFAPRNLIHIIINNGAHETVGGLPTVAKTTDLTAVASACGYPNAVCVDNIADLDRELHSAKARSELSLIEVRCSIGSRKDLGRPTTTAMENRNVFMDYLKTL